MRPQSRSEFETAIICALPLEFDAVDALFDEHYDNTVYGKQNKETKTSTEQEELANTASCSPSCRE